MFCFNGLTLVGVGVSAGSRRVRELDKSSTGVSQTCWFFYFSGAGLSCLLFYQSSLVYFGLDLAVGWRLIARKNKLFFVIFFGVSVGDGRNFGSGPCEWTRPPLPPITERYRHQNETR